MGQKYSNTATTHDPEDNPKIRLEEEKEKLKSNAIMIRSNAITELDAYYSERANKINREFNDRIAEINNMTESSIGNAGSNEYRVRITWT